MGTAREILDDLRAMPGVAPALDALAGIPALWAVGGSVRDALLQRDARELDLVAEDDDALVAALGALGGDAVVHDRFGTATVAATPGRIAVDLVRARAETYPAPGALPEVRPGSLDDDLARRDVTVNAIAVRLTAPEELRAVPGALDDLAAGRLRVLHGRSFLDDPTRLWRLARYAARLGFAPEEGTRALARAAGPDVLATVSGPRLGQEVRLALREPDPLAALRAGHDLQPALLPEGVDLDPAGLDAALDLLPEDGDRGLLVLAACMRGVDSARLVAWLDELAFPASARDIVAAGYREVVRAPLARARTASEIARAARGAPVEVVALAGGENARRWIEELRHVRPAVSGEDLLAAGVPQGPEIGRRLARARDAQLDGVAPDRESQLAVALADGEGGGA